MNYISCLQVCYKESFGYLHNIFIMASPGQRCGSCGHIMAGFDLHKKCARCRDKKMGDDPCVKGQHCDLCDSFSDSQKGMLATPQYQIRKDKKAGTLVSPSKVTVVGPVDNQTDFEMVPDAAHAQERVITGSSPTAFGQASVGDFVSRQDLELLNNQLEEKFARFEALLSRTNIFSTPKMPGSTIQAPISDTPFINPSPDPGATCPVRPPGQELEVSPAVKKHKGKSKQKKAFKPASSAGSSDQIASDPIPPPKTVVPSPGLQTLEKPEETVSSFTSVTSLGSASQPVITGPQHSSGSASFAPDSFVHHRSATFQWFCFLCSGQFCSAGSGSVRRGTPSGSGQIKTGEEGELSDSEVAERNEEMNYRETVRSVRSFLGWSCIPDFEAAVGDTDNRSDNPWKGKHPRRTGKVSVELPADDWLCYKMEKLNTRAAEGYPSRAQEAAGLKQDQFIRTPKSQAKWYTQSRIKQDGNQRPGRTIYGWSRSEARLNSQFSRIAKISSYPSSGPASRPISQEILRRWDQCARESSLITNHAAGFNRCVSEIQDKMNQHISFLNSTIVKGKAPKEVTDAVKDLKDLSAFHSSVSVALGTAFQHLADSLFVQLANFILLRRDSYLEYVRPGLKPDTWNKLRNAPLFTYGLFPDDVLAVAEQDIQKHESNRSAPGPGSGTYQHSKKHQFRYQPYDKKDSRQSVFLSSQTQQPWRQFSGRGRGKNRGRGGSSSTYYSKPARGSKPYK